MTLVLPLMLPWVLLPLSDDRLLYPGGAYPCLPVWVVGSVPSLWSQESVSDAVLHWMQVLKGSGSL